MHHHANVKPLMSTLFCVGTATLQCPHLKYYKKKRKEGRYKVQNKRGYKVQNTRRYKVQNKRRYKVQNKRRHKVQNKRRYKVQNTGRYKVHVKKTHNSSVQGLHFTTMAPWPLGTLVLHRRWPEPALAVQAPGVSPPAKGPCPWPRGRSVPSARSPWSPAAPGIRIRTAGILGFRDFRDFRDSGRIGQGFEGFRDSGIQGFRIQDSGIRGIPGYSGIRGI